MHASRHSTQHAVNSPSVCQIQGSKTYGYKYITWFTTRLRVGVGVSVRVGVKDSVGLQSGLAQAGERSAVQSDVMLGVPSRSKLPRRVWGPSMAAVLRTPIFFLEPPSQTSAQSAIPAHISAQVEPDCRVQRNCPLPGRRPTCVGHVGIQTEHPFQGRPAPSAGSLRTGQSHAGQQ